MRITTFGLAVLGTTIACSSALAGGTLQDSMLDPSMAADWGGFYLEASGSGSNYLLLSEGWTSAYNPWLGFGGAAGAVLHLGGNMSAQVDLKSWSVGDSSGPNEYTTFGTLADAHLNWTFGHFNAGVFGGLLATNGYYDAGRDFDVLGGVEGQMQVSDMVTLDGQIGFVKNVSSYYPFTQVAFGQAGVRVFPTDNLKLEGAIGAVAGQIGDSSGENAATITLNAEAEYRFDQTPYSVFARFSGYDDTRGLGSTGTTVSIGARLNLDGLTLKQSNATGATHKLMDMSTISWLRLDGY